MSYVKTNWINNTTPINATNLNKIENQLEANSIANDYSTNEQAIGTWIDGKTIYRKVISLGTLPNATDLIVPSEITETIFPIKIYGIALKSTETFPLPFIWGASGSMNFVGLFYNTSNNTFFLRTDRNMSTYTGYGIIEYTKTTD